MLSPVSLIGRSMTAASPLIAIALAASTFIAACTVQLPSPQAVSTGEQEGSAASQSDTRQEATTRSAATSAALAPELVKANETYATILAHAVTESGLVRYTSLDEPKWRRAIASVISAYAAARAPVKRNDHIALLFNTYNINVIQQVMIERDKDPSFSSVMDVPGFFDQRTVTVLGSEMTLNDLENKHIRPIADARLHVALVCAAVSCPPLRDEPFTGDALNAQLDDQCRRWINDPNKNTARDGALMLSPIFQWYKQDFSKPPYNGVAHFVSQFAKPSSALAKLLGNNPDADVRHLSYDWSINDASEHHKRQIIRPESAHSHAHSVPPGMPEAPPPADDPMEVSPRDLRAMLNDGQPLTLIDCRTEQEHAIASIDGGELIPMDVLSTHLEDLRARATNRIVVYCHHGVRSMIVARFMRQQGFAGVRSLAGGIDRWAVEVDPSLARYGDR